MPDPIAMLAEWNLVFYLARDHARFAIDAALGLDDHAPTFLILWRHKICLYAL
jgi:hypothetical protein